MEFPNRGLKLRPGMYAQISLSGAAEEALVVPAEAVIRTGRRAVVYVVQPDKPGRYTPVEIELGREIDGKLVVRKGLSAGQQVVASGQFLIDSEASFAGLLARAGDAPAPAASKPTHQGTGVVTEINREAATLNHGPIPSMQWGAMTMAFKFPDAAQAQSIARGIARGDRVRFRFYQSGDDYVLERIEKLPGAEQKK
jgi:Cu(I)/Ag(I) efflux system membrane fusion protein